jgi:hypothetical protein
MGLLVITPLVLHFECGDSIISLKIKSLILRIMHPNWLLFLSFCWFFSNMQELVIIMYTLNSEQQILLMRKKALKESSL